MKRESQNYFFNKDQHLKKKFTMIESHHIPRNQNVKVDALFGLVASMLVPQDEKLEIDVVK